MLHGEIENNIKSLLKKAAFDVLREPKAAAMPPDDMAAELEIPKDKAHGDLSSNIAMKTCRFASMNPVKLASSIKELVEKEISASGIKAMVEKVEVKAPGFINFFLSRECLYGSMRDIRRGGERYGSSMAGAGRRVQIEFVSANPTGPLTIAHARQAAIGDSLANILKFIGYEVEREYYLNDEGNQMNMLADSIRVRYRQSRGRDDEFPADGYKGSYIKDAAADFYKAYGDKYVDEKDLDVFRQFGLDWMMKDIDKDLADFGVKFDVWYSQKSLREAGKIEKALDLLKEKGHIFEQDGAVWFRATTFGDDKDRVVIKSDKSFTYLAPDIAYHLEKYRRGYSRIIDIWGPDHHGYIPRMRAAVRAMGFDAESLSVLIVQLATLYRGGQVVRMSTRAGEFVTLREVMDEVGKDVARFCFLMRRISSQLDFDIDVVKKESAENPVYYIQYAHARICSILKYSGLSGPVGVFDPGLLKEPEELGILRLLRQFALVAHIAGSSLEPYVVIQYLQDLAASFHSFYTKHRVVSDDAELTKARLELVGCVKTVLANGLGLLGVSLPEKM